MNFKKRVNGSWTDTPNYIHKTSTDTITTLPADIYANDTTATVGLKGNMYQASGMSPTNPIQPQECGDLETTGTHAGQYKIPISSAGQTTPVYLGEVQTTRKIRKLVLTGEENFNTDTYSRFSIFIGGIKNVTSRTGHSYCSHYECLYHAEPYDNDWNNVYYQSGATLYFHDRRFSTVADFKSYLAAQYAAGTPVTVWYVLATEETAVVNEPLRKIGDYADTVSGITIPTTAGANAVDVLTTLKPSEVSVNYKGWHPVQSVHEAENGQWD